MEGCEKKILYIQLGFSGNDPEKLKLKFTTEMMSSPTILPMTISGGTHYPKAMCAQKCSPSQTYPSIRSIYPKILKVACIFFWYWRASKIHPKKTYSCHCMDGIGSPGYKKKTPFKQLGLQVVSTLRVQFPSCLPRTLLVHRRWLKMGEFLGGWVTCWWGCILGRRGRVKPGDIRFKWHFFPKWLQYTKFMMVHLKNDGFQVRNLLTGTCFSGEPCQISGVQRLSRLFENVDGNIRGILPIRLKTPQEAGANTQRRKKTAACASCPGFVQVTQTSPLVVLVILIKLNATRFHHYIFKKSPSLKLAQHLKKEYVAISPAPN